MKAIRFSEYACLAILIILATFFFSACATLGGPTTGSIPLLVGAEYHVPDSPVVVRLAPSAKGDYGFEFEATEGDITDWLAVGPDGEWIVRTRNGPDAVIRRGPDGRPQIMLRIGEDPPEPAPIQPTK